MPRNRNHTWIAALMAASLLCLWAYSAYLHAFDDDEFQHARTAWLMQTGHRPYADFFEHHLILYHGLIAPFVWLPNEESIIFALRTLSLVAGLAALLLLYQTGRHLGASPLAAATGVWLLGMAPMFVLKMTEARPEAPAILCFAAGLRWVFPPRRDSAATTGRHNPRSSAETGNLGADKSVQTVESGESEAIAQPSTGASFPLQALGVGLLAALAALLSQKYIFPAGGLLLAVLILHGRRHALTAGLSFGLAMAAYVGWMLMLGIGRPAFDLVVVMNSQWVYRFSPLGYTVELFITAGVLTAAGAAGILYACRRMPPRTAATLALLLVASTLLIVIIPVPYRQSFLPLMMILAIGVMPIMTNLLELTGRLPPARSQIAVLLALPILAAGSLSALPEHLAADNRQDRKTMAAVADFAPSGSIFDGRGLLFKRPPINYYPIMHAEILKMLDPDDYAQSVVAGLLEAGLPPVIMDYRTAMMPADIAVFVEEHYLPTDIDDLYGAGTRFSRLTPGDDSVLELAVPGYWQASWGGGSIAINSRPLAPDQSVYLTAGEHRLAADGLVWNFSLQKNYRREAGR